jgi:hypothetical protein
LANASAAGAYHLRHDILDAEDDQTHVEANRVDVIKLQIGSIESDGTTFGTC